MRRKALQGVANTLCHMVDGDGRCHDEERLAALGSGLLRIDVLTGDATHNGQPVVPPLYLAGRMSQWLETEFGRLRLARNTVRHVLVEVPYEVAAMVEDGQALWVVGLTCRSEVATDEATYRGTPAPGREQLGFSVQR